MNAIMNLSKDLIEVDLLAIAPNRLFIKVPKEAENWREKVKMVAGRQWHPNLILWSIPYCKDTVRHFHRLFNGKVHYNFELNTNIPNQYIPPKRVINKIVVKQKVNDIIPKHVTAITDLEEQMIILRYSHRTIKPYKTHLKAFILYYNEIPPKDITGEQIKQYLFFLISKRKISRGTQTQVVSAIKCYYENVLNQPKTTYYIKHPKKSKELPNVLSEQEVTKIINVTSNIKHKCMLMLMYSAGLRIGEVTNLTIHDIKSDENCILIKNAKGNKDRYTLLAPKLLDYLRIYYKAYRPSYWLFEGQTGGQYSVRSIQNVFTASKTKAKVNPLATPHTLRHSFATHLVHQGINLRYIQELLGHESSKTTEIYTHIAKTDFKNLQSPLENLKI